MLQAALILAALFAQDDKEPEEQFFLEFDGKKIPIQLDKPFELDTKGKKQAKITVAPYRVFKHAGLKFRYPRAYGFEADIEDPDTRGWTLDGNNVVIMIYRYKGNPLHKELRNTTASFVRMKFGPRNVKSEETKIKLEGKEVDGVLLRINLAGERLTQAMYSFVSEEDSYLLMFQDSPGEDGKPTQEFLDMQKLLTESFRFPKNY
jgi:hypothetical protein